MDLKLSDRASGVKEYYFAGKLRQIAAMRAEGIDVISLGVGGPDLPPPLSVREMLSDSAMKSDTHGYQPHTGTAGLRRAWADWCYRIYGVRLDAATEVLPLAGSKEGVTHVSLAFLNPGDRALVPDPGYPAYSSATRMAGGEPLYYRLDSENGWQPDFDALESMDLSDVKLMWLNYPHMPTGAPARRETFEKCVDFARRHGIVLVHDNPYSLILHRAAPLSLLSVDGAIDVAVEFNSLSKSHNMPGWRTGVAVGNPEILKAMLRMKSNIDSGQFLPVMLAAEKALGEGTDWSEELNRVYARRRVIVEKVMDALGCTFDHGQTGLFLWGKIKNAGLDSASLADMVLDKAKVFITPGFIFGPGGEGYIRLSLCAPEELLVEALERIEQLNLNNNN